MQLLGPIVKLQVQRSSLKVAVPPGKRYDPTPLAPVATLRLTADGVVGVVSPDEPVDVDVVVDVVVDVHHRDHPATKNLRGRNGVSVGFTSHYAAMRDRFGARLVDGIAGENILIHTDERVDEASLAQGLVIETQGGERVHLHSVCVAEPCLEFTRFALGYAEVDRMDQPVTEGLRFLRAGTRGFYASFAGPVGLVRPGDHVFRL